MDSAEYSNVFHLVADITRKQKVSICLIGGFAVNYYKVSRHTADVDFLITEEDFKEILDTLEKSGYKQDFIQKVFVRFKSNNLSLLDIDFMFVDKGTLDKIIESGKEITITKEKFIIPSLEHLIALKIHALKYNYKIRLLKDLPDIINLIRFNNVDIKSDKFRNLCLKYGDKEIYNKILESL